jgi:hypothetical protein
VSEKPLRCPFCGENDFGLREIGRRIRDDGMLDAGEWLGEHWCGAGDPQMRIVLKAKTFDQAVALWNRRASPIPTQE